MATLGNFCLLLIIFLFPLHRFRTRGEQICNGMSCGEIDIQFPFGLKGANLINHRCSYPRFQLSCENQSQTILTLPYSGDLVVKRINYEEQTIVVNDPDGCLPKRFLQNLSFSGSPFMFDTDYGFLNLTFLRCPSNITESYPLPPISCLSEHSSNSTKGNSNNSSSVIVSWLRPTVSSRLSEWCEVMSSTLFPIPNMAMWPFWPDLNSDIQLTWTKPICGDCAARGQVCGFAGDTGLRVECFSSPNRSQGLPRSAKYGLSIGVGLPGLLCVIGLSCFICGKFRMFLHPRRPSTQLPTSIALQPVPFIMGLDRPTIEKYPKTVVGLSGRLPKPNDNTCPICLSEYEPNEILRTIPECSHYFHAHCVDEWLKMNATCPLCRNSPDPSSTFTPSAYLSPSSSLSSSP